MNLVKMLTSYPLKRFKPYSQKYLADKCMFLLITLKPE